MGVQICLGLIRQDPRGSPKQQKGRLAGPLAWPQARVTALRDWTPLSLPCSHSCTPLSISVLVSLLYFILHINFVLPSHLFPQVYDYSHRDLWPIIFTDLPLEQKANFPQPASVTCKDPTWLEDVPTFGPGGWVQY